MKTLRGSVIVTIAILQPAILCAQGEITLIAPGGIRAAVEQLIPGFEKKTGRKVKATFGSGLGTKRQVAHGEAFDVPIVQPPYQEVLDSGNVVAGTATPLASVSVGIAVRKGAPKLDLSTAAGAMAMVAKGEAEIGLTFLSEMDDPGVEPAGPLPREISPPTSLVGFVSAHAKDPAAAKSLLEYLSAADAAAVYRAKGMQAAR